MVWRAYIWMGLDSEGIEIMSTYQDFEIYCKIREISILGKKELSYSKNRLYLASKPTKQF